MNNRMMECEEESFDKFDNNNESLEGVLQILGAKRPFSPALISEQNPEGFTKAGSNAYEKLTTLLYKIGRITGKSLELNAIVEELDKISLEN